MISVIHILFPQSFLHTLLQSHSKRVGNMETGTVLTEISILFWNLPNCRKQWDHFKKHWLLWGKQLFAVDFYVFLDDINADTQMDSGIRNWFSNIKDTFAERFQLQMSVLLKRMSIFKASLSNLSDCWAKYN